ncbi:hypothetical protein BGZ60DRAFT_39437 [Tricladium varicosporioides]|nr:hypothetical protein BGZ60DRAFT_39437 [Hymenoscyphus varicosporioides]
MRKAHRKSPPSSLPRAGQSTTVNLQLLTPDTSPMSSPAQTFSGLAISQPVCREYIPTPTTVNYSRDTSSSINSTPQIPPLFVTEYFEVRKSNKKGMAAYATKNIKKNTVIMGEDPLFIAEFMEVYYKFESLTMEQKKEYMTLCDWRGLEKEKILAIFSVNRFNTGDSKCGIFVRSSRFNHACHPYAVCTYSWVPEKYQLVITTVMEVKEGTELTIAYTSNPSSLKRNYGFWCDCPGCPSMEVREAEQKAVDKAFPRE